MLTIKKYPRLSITTRKMNNTIDRTFSFETTMISLKGDSFKNSTETRYERKNSKPEPITVLNVS